MQDRARVVLVVVVFAVVIGVPLAILFASGGGDDEPEAKPKAAAGDLRVERDAVGSALTIYVKPAANVPERAGGRRQVLLDCVDSDSDTVLAQDEAWPFAQTDNGQYLPHAHMTLDPLSITAVERCLLRGTEPLLEGPVR
jgi:hypothetical protein